MGQAAPDSVGEAGTNERYFRANGHSSHAAVPVSATLPKRIVNTAAKAPR